MRLFIAIGAQELSFDPQEDLKKIRVNLKKKEFDHRWVPQENYHITLRFLGETPSEEVDRLSDLLQKVSENHSPFTLKLEGVGVFNSRVIWMGVQNSRELRALEEELTLHLPREEKAFVPHLTLARLRSPHNLNDVISPLKNHFFGELKVTHLTLYESIMAGNWPLYKPIEKFELKKGA